uniref:Uncharacterized protein n=1 Tax=Chromera velia CCMP2878 TaxID=1169474 RepID=A0A0G4HAT4_9ALVE|eukprot:Cvel_25623.t1-p1 / transcript=Cvel_25623.t1 / gene=Cvel_25623 / organism=Chromera_velia_CCMP2878 / gene_product=hypothetical protein / transcript_product=hypothetical protein / location=Cvel_scaffold2928:4564-5550(+) / protein_length=329 / sequence_SO=supercontig / SO=protein_coding / is_pseudo=false
MAQSGIVNVPDTSQTAYVQIKERMDEQQKTIAEMQRSLLCLLKLFRDVGQSESLVRSLNPDLLTDGGAGSAPPRDVLMELQTLRKERSERARHVLFSVYLPHLRVVRSRFEEKKKEVAALVASWSSAHAAKKTRAKWLGSLTKDEKILWKFIEKDVKDAAKEDSQEFNERRRASSEGAAWTQTDQGIQVIWEHGLPSLWALFFLRSPNPSLLATWLMLPVLLLRPGYYASQGRNYFNSREKPFDGTLPNVRLLAPVDSEFLSRRRDVLRVLWKVAMGNPRIPGVRMLCQWMVTASHVGDWETVGWISSFLTEKEGLSSALWVARHIEGG